MSALDEARRAAPLWVTLVGPIAAVLVALITTAVLGRLTYRLAWGPAGEIPEDELWTERARRVQPVRLTTVFVVMIFPAVSAFVGALFVGPLARVGNVTSAVLAAAASLVIAVHLHLKTTRRILERDHRLADSLRSLGTMLVVLFPALPLAVAFAFAVPSEPVSLLAGLWWIAALTTGWLAARGYTFVVGRWLGLVTPPSDRLLAVVARASRVADRPPPPTWTLRWWVPNALALPSGNLLAFTEGILETLDDDELAAICAHELGHLSEPARIKAMRLGLALGWVPVALTFGYAERWGLPVALGSLLLFVLASFALRGMQQRMEHRADAHAHDHEAQDDSEPGTYARALEKLHRRALIPAVLNKRATHPHLYDRMVKAGVTPDYPRPEPPKMRRYGLAVTVTAVVLVVVALVPLVGKRLIATALPAEQGHLFGAATDPQGVWDLGALADLHAEAKRHDQAVLFYEAAIATWGAHPEANVERQRLMDLLVDLERCDRAQSLLTEFLEMAEDEEEAAAEAAYVRARCLPRAGDQGAP